MGAGGAFRGLAAGGVTGQYLSTACSQTMKCNEPVALTRRLRLPAR